MAESPSKSPQHQILKSPVQFLLPSPIITRRTRTHSTSKAAANNPVKTGVVKEFCKHKGHGFIVPSEKDAETLFVHVSDVEGEYVPCAGDHVTYKECLIPPKKVKIQAVEVIITHLAPGVKHHRWEDQED